MSTLEDRVIEGLVEKYNLNGRLDINKILGNALFRDLPLSAKAAFIEKYRDRLSVAPRPDYGKVIAGILGGATIGVVGGLTSGMTIPGPINTKALALAAGAGAISGGVIQGFSAYNDYNQAVETENSLDDAIKALLTHSYQTRETPKQTIDILRGAVGPLHTQAFNWGVMQRPIPRPALPIK